MKRLLAFRDSCYAQVFVYDESRSDDLGELKYAKDVYLQGYSAIECAVAFVIYRGHPGLCDFTIWEGELLNSSTFDGVATTIVNLPSGQVCIHEPAISPPNTLGLEPGRYDVAIGWRKKGKGEEEMEVEIFFLLRQ